MTTLPSSGSGIKHSFEMITRSFLHSPGLAFSSVLNAVSIRQAFEQEDACFADDAIFSTEIVLWAFLAQTLRDGKGAACAAAVADIATHLLQTGQRPPSGDTGDYCRGRAKLNLAALQRLVRQSGRQLERAADPSWLWNGRHAKLVDGFTFTMPDTPANQDAFPQQKSQTPGVGFPIAQSKIGTVTISVPVTYSIVNLMGDCPYFCCCAACHPSSSHNGPPGLIRKGAVLISVGTAHPTGLLNRRWYKYI